VAADAMTRDFRVVNANLTLRQFTEVYVLAQDTSPKTYFAAADGRYRGLVRVQDLQDIERSEWERTILADIARPLTAIPSVPENATLATTIERLEQCGESSITVLSPAGAVAGTIDRGDIVRAIATAHNLPISPSEIQQIKSEGIYPNYFPLSEIAKGLEED
jgi:CBS domain-containing protein